MQDVGETYAYPDEQRAASRVLMDQNGNSIEVRTSGYADFAGEQTPEGSGSVIAVVPNTAISCSSTSGVLMR